jgi:superfamily II DNA/RNA helicase
VTSLSLDAPGVTFASLGLPQPLITALHSVGIDSPFPIQAATLPDALAGRDVLGRGRTGSGKTLAFCLPVVARLVSSDSRRTPKRPRALILAPTRELATQINATLAPLAKALGLRTVTVFGGVGAQPQIAALKAGVDVVVACPGRLEEHVGDGHCRLDAIEITVLDEADHLCDLGFLPSVRRLLDRTPNTSQRLLFSATLDQAVEDLVRKYLRQPVTHSVDPASSAVVEMEHHVLHLTAAERLAVLVELTTHSARTMVFTRTKHRAKTLARQLTAAGVPAVEMHGNLAQNARVRNLAAFSDGSATTLVATDIAARGIHVDEVALVVHADPPEEHKAYLHRSGRTARAGASGTVVTLMTDEQESDVRTLTRKAGIKPTVTKVERAHPILRELALNGAEPEPGAPAPRVVSAEQQAAAAAIIDTRAPRGAGRSNRPKTGSAPAKSRGAQPRSGQARPAQARSGQARPAQARAGQPRSAQQPSGPARTAKPRSGEPRSAAPASAGQPRPAASRDQARPARQGAARPASPAAPRQRQSRNARNAARADRG